MRCIIIENSDLIRRASRKEINVTFLAQQTTNCVSRKITYERGSCPSFMPFNGGPTTANEPTLICLLLGKAKWQITTGSTFYTYTRQTRVSLSTRPFACSSAPLRESMHARLGGRFKQKLEGTELGKFTQGSTGQLEPNNLINNIKSEVVHRETILTHNLMK